MDELESVVRSTGPARAGAVKKLLEDPDPAVRGEAAAALGRLKDAAAFAELSAAAASGDASLRLGAIEGLGASGDNRAAAVLVKLLKEGDTNTRWKAAQALGRLKAPAALEPLAAAARNDASDSVRVSAVEAIGKTGGARAEAALKDLAASKDARLAGWAVNVLKAK